MVNIIYFTMHIVMVVSRNNELHAICLAKVVDGCFYIEIVLRPGMPARFMEQDDFPCFCAGSDVVDKPVVLGTSYRMVSVLIKHGDMHIAIII